MSIERLPPAHREDYRWFLDISTRWMDNDVYGHVNTVVYYSYIDTIVNRYLIDVGMLDIHSGPVIGIVPESACRFHRSFAY
jgi:acyl-CoA thioester hydrolase